MQFMQFNQVVNNTDHQIDVYDADGKVVLWTLPAGDVIIRGRADADAIIVAVEQDAVPVGAAVVDGVRIPIYRTAFERLWAFGRDHHRVAVPELRDDVFRVVEPLAVIVAPDRTDFILEGPWVLRHGEPIGCKGLIVPDRPSAAQELNAGREAGD
jgi:hypothetical protein